MISEKEMLRKKKGKGIKKNDKIFLYERINLHYT